MRYRVVYRDQDGSECRSRTMSKKSAIAEARAVADRCWPARVIRDGDGVELGRYTRHDTHGVQYQPNPAVP